ncbi:MAG: hypothetical protein ABL914_07690 [Novosphingobium sp.]|uniref:hypothetical protein n=1 Tax=Novosphingobium sp. TaxID=1874826 RepID=UPI0032B93228
MFKISRFTFAALGIMGLSLMAGQSHAQPSYAEDMARQHAQEAQIMQQSHDQAEWEAENSDTDEGDDYWSDSRFSSAPPQSSINWIARAAELERAEHEQRLANDPTYRALYEGVWTFHQSKPTDPQPTCIATFWTLKGGVTMIHWGGKENITMLGFFGGVFPKPAKPEMVQLDLTQSGEKQSVRAFSMRFGPEGNLGMFVFLVPSAQALLDSIEDKQDFQVGYKGGPAVGGVWHSGLKARAELTKCLASLPTVASQTGS